MVTELVTRFPPPALRGHLIRCEGFAERADGPLRRREAAYPAIPVIVSLGPEWLVLDPQRPDGGPVRHGSFVTGLWDGPALVEHAGEARSIQLDLTPLGAYSVFGVAMHELAGRCVALGELIGESTAVELTERLAAAPGWNQRFTFLERFLADRIAAARRVPAPDAVRSWRRRHLAARFREQVGLPPKAVARVLRFRRALDLLRARGGGAWGDIAQECGYADQPHFNRDFRDLAGTSPGDFLASLLPGGAGVAADPLDLPAGAALDLPFVQDARTAVA